MALWPKDKTELASDKKGFGAFGSFPIWRSRLWRHAGLGEVKQDESKF